MVDADALLASLESTIGQEALIRAVCVVEDLTLDQGDVDASVRAEMLDRFPTIRRLIPPLIEEVPFGAAEGGKAVLAESRPRYGCSPTS
jgi:hypothetical protein